jgi:hypothetical protein
VQPEDAPPGLPVFWGLRLHLVCTLHGLPVMFAIAGAKASEREVLLAMLEVDAALVDARPGQAVIGDKNYFGRNFEADLTGRDLTLLRPVRKGEAPRAGQQFFRPLRQVIEAVNQSLKGQLDLEGHGGRTEDGITIRVLYRILALTAAIWHNDKTGQETMTSGKAPGRRCSWSAPATPPSGCWPGMCESRPGACPPPGWV